MANESNLIVDGQTLVFSDDDYKKAAKIWTKEFLLIPLLSIKSVLQYFTGMGGVRYKAALPSVKSEAQFGPYNPNRITKSLTNVKYRELETFLGSVIEDFEPNHYVSLLIGKMAGILGDAQKSAPSVKLVIAAFMKSLGWHFREALFKAVRDSEGNTTMELFNGFDTIITNDIDAGKISDLEGNYLDVGLITSVNACDKLKEMERSCTPELRSMDKFLYCDPEIADMYEDSYLATHQAVIYNKQFEQQYLEGSRKHTTIIPIDSMAGTNRAIITPKWNMLYGYDNMSQLETLQIDRFAPFLLTLSALMFFGTQIHTIDPRCFKVFEYTTEEEEEPETVDPPVIEDPDKQEQQG